MRKKMSFPQNKIGFNNDTKDYKRVAREPGINNRDAYAPFPKYHRVLLPGNNYILEFSRFPVPLLHSNIEYGDPQVQLFCSTELRNRRETVLEGVANYIELLNGDTNHIADNNTKQMQEDRYALLLLGEQRVLLQRRIECELWEGSPFSMSIKRLQFEHLVLDNNSYPRTNCQNHFKQYWPEDYKCMISQTLLGESS